MLLLYSLLDYLLMALQVVIFVQVILSWLLAFNVVSRHSQLVGGLIGGLDQVTEPIYRPIRRILPDTGALDLTPMAVLLIVLVIRNQILQPLINGAQSAPVM